MVQTGHVERFNGALRACEPYLEDPRFIEAVRIAPFQPRGNDVSVVLDLMIHDIDLISALVRSPVADVDAVGMPVLYDQRGHRQRAAAVRQRLRRQHHGQPRAPSSGAADPHLPAHRLLSVDLAAGTGEFLRLKPGARLPEGGEMGVAALLGLVERIELKGDGQEPLRAELEAWVAAVRGEGPLVVSGEAGRDALRVALQIMERIEQHAAAGLAARP